MELHKISIEDAGKLYARTSIPEVAQYMRFDAHTDVAQARELIQEYQTYARAYLCYEADELQAQTLSAYVVEDIKVHGESWRKADLR